MSFYLPEFIDEQVDSSTDPLAIMLMREGSYSEAYQMARTQRAGQQQLVEHALIQQRPDLTSEDEYDQLYVARRERRLNKPSVVITQTEQESDLKLFEARLAAKRRIARS